MPKDIKNETLEKIKKENIKPHSKNYFWALNILLYSLTAILILGAIYIFNLMFYLPHRTPFIPGSQRPGNLLSLFPWPLLIVGSLIVGILIYLYRYYEGGYKKHFAISALIIFGLMIFGGALFAGSKINQRLEKRPGIKRFYQWNEDNFMPRDGRGRQRQHDLRPGPNFR